MASMRFPPGTLARLVRKDPQGDDTHTVKMWNVDVDFPEICEKTPTERPFMELEALGAPMIQDDRLSLEFWNPTNANIEFNPATSKVSLPMRLLNLRTKKLSNRVLTPMNFDSSSIAMAAGNTIPMYPRQWNSAGEYVVPPAVNFKLGHETAGGLDKNNDRVLVVPYQGQ